MSGEENKTIKCAAIEAVLATGLLPADEQGVAHQWPLPLPAILKIQFARKYFRTVYPTCIIALLKNDNDVTLYLKCDEKDKPVTTLVLKKASLQDIACQLFPFGFVQTQRQSIINLHYFEGVDGDTLLLRTPINNDIKIGASFEKQVTRLLDIYLRGKNCIDLFGNI